MSRKYFGTDGVRGRVGEPPMSPDFVLKLGWAAGRVLGEAGARKVLIGKDTRISGYMFESALEAGLSAAGMDIHLLGPMPTPGIAYLTRTLRASAGIVISASHNPFYDNGVKFFSAEGRKLPDEVERQIEAAMKAPMKTVEPAHLGKAVRVGDAAGRYIEFCKSTIPLGMGLHGLKIAVDCANGATYHITPNVLRELGAEVVEHGVRPDGLNINRDCGSTHTAELRSLVLKEGCDLGVALDGDGDRVVMVDERGDEVDGDELLYVIARDRHHHHAYDGGVVGTLMSNLGLEVALQELGMPFVRAKVGDRYVLEGLNEKGWLLGGESSGHIICLDRTTTGDGTVSALQVIAAMLRSGKRLSELRRQMSKFPQTLINVPLDRRMDLGQVGSVQQAVQTAEAELGRRGRVLLRPSGTEPLMRVMVEGEDAGLVERCAQQIADAVREAAQDV